MLKRLARHQINTRAWDTCVAMSAQRIVYGYSWYLDAVLPAPSWKWIGLVLLDEQGTYLAVMPVPLRRKQLVGLSYAWVVHQPFFCQFLAVFSIDTLLDPTPFCQLVNQQFRYGSIINLRRVPASVPPFESLRVLATHTLNLSVGYDRIYQKYTDDRKANLRRALRMNWNIVDSDDPESLLALFRKHHADTISGGVAEWAYAIFRRLTKELSQRGLLLLRYACHNGYIEAGALFVQEGDRIIYLFNAASEIGRRGNARTLLIDQLIREKAGKQNMGQPLLFDFESPEKASIRRFYQSFGAVEELFWTAHWSRLNAPERVAQRIRKLLKKGVRFS